MTSEKFIEWAKEQGIVLMFIQPGKPNQIAFVERFNRSFRDEVLNANLFNSATLHFDDSVAEGGNSVELERGIEKFFRVRVQSNHRGHQALRTCSRHHAAEQLGMAGVNAVEVSNGERSALGK